MKTTGRWSAHEEIERDPAKPFVDDIKTDLGKINEFYGKKEALMIKMKMIEAITNEIKKITP